MSTSDIIQVISIVCTSILSIVAIIISVITLIQNNKMIFESNKPNIIIFSKVISFSSPHYLLILRNFGLSGATILNVEYDHKLDTYLDREPFKHMQNVYLAPNQSYIYPLNPHNEPKEIIKFKITYSYLGKTYVEDQSVNFAPFKDVCYVKVHSSKDMKELSDVLQEMTIQNI